VNLCLALSGTRAGLTEQVAFDLQSPDGDRKFITTQNIQFGMAGGCRLLVPLDVTFATEGLHWLNINVAGRILTRVPVEFEYRSTGTEAPTQTAPGGGSHEKPAAIAAGRLTSG